MVTAHFGNTCVQEHNDKESMTPVYEITEALKMVKSDSPVLAAQGFSKISHATFDNQNAKEAAGQAGAIEAIVNAMERNISDETVQKDGCHALREVALQCEANMVQIREQGALNAVLKAMEAHPENEAVQAEGLWALVDFCSNTEENVTTAKKHQSIVDKALDTHKANGDIQGRGQLLQKLFTGAYVG
ncbi:hypothetical protein PHYBOEH_007122 [Phytophthora boehmeriae]|uniref:LRRK2 ARM repeat domain-containing protein n=1 Tax=Phytophthora boehmeriae TaxID=109152 RepID=A0A8T1X431_9STRA|nr:hypothetical protein PHYBOEH_007122 [Phytophthora boehmeriae]